MSHTQGTGERARHVGQRSDTFEHRVPGDAYRITQDIGSTDVSETVEEFDVDAARKWINSNRTPEEKRQNAIDRAAYYKYKKNMKSRRKGRKRKYQKPFNFLKELVLQL